MPGNEAEDRFHNFFPQVDLSSGHHHSQTADGSWQGLGNNQWPGSQREIGLPSSISKGYNVPQSDTDRVQSSHSFQVADGLNYSEPMLGSVLAKSYSQSQLPNSNGYTHGCQTMQTRQNEANFLGVVAESDRYNTTSRGLSTHETHGKNGLENNVGSVRSESSKSQTNFDFLGGQEQMSGQHIGMFQSLPQQLSGFNDRQIMQHVMLRKMQEFQRQQLEGSHNNSLNQNPSIINGTPISPFTAASNSAWPTELSAGNNSWLHRATQAAQGLPNARFPPEQGQPLIFNQSTYGCPVSNTRGSPGRDSHVSVDNHQMQQMATYSKFSPGDQYRGPTHEVNVQDGSLSSKLRFQEGNFFGQPSGQGLTRGGMYLGTSQLVNSLQAVSPVQELAGPSGKMGEKAVMPVLSPQNAVALDPTEEKILFGDGNIWDSFGDSANVGEVGGSWSALMQSAVAETSSNDLELQEEWSGPGIQNTEIAVGPLSNDVNINKSFQGIPGYQQSVPKSPYEYGDRLQMDFDQKVFQHSSEEQSKLRHDPLQKPFAKGTQSYQNTTHSSDAKSMPGLRAAQQNVPSHISGQLYGKPNGHDDTVTPLSSRNDVTGFYSNEGRLQRSDINDQKRMFHGELSQGVHMWKMVPGPQSNGGLEQVRMDIGSPQVNRDELNLNNCSGSLNSSTARDSEWTSPNSNNLNIRKQAEPSKFMRENTLNLNKGYLFPKSSMNGSGNDLSRMHKTENSEKRENSSESQHSNISQHANDKVRLDGSEASNLLGEKQKGPGQGGQNVFGPRKFQYHPMGNSDENMESSFRRKNVSNNQSPRNSGQSKIFGQFPKTSSEMVKGHMFQVQQNEKGAADSSSRGTLAGFARNNSPLSQNVPEFLKDVDQSKENNNSDGSIGPLQQSQSPSSRDFGLQLGFQSFPTQNHALSHSSAQLAGSISSAHTTHEIREKDNTSQVQPFHSFHEASKRKEMSGTRPSSNDAPKYSTLGNLNSASTSGFSFSTGQLQGQQVIGVVDSYSPHSSQIRNDQKDRLLSPGDTSKITQAMVTPDEVAPHESSIERMHNAWTKPPNQQNLLGGLSHNKFPPGIFHPGQLNNNAASSLGKVQQDKGGLHQLGSSADLSIKPSASQGKDSALKNQSDASPLNSASTERDFEAFGRSSKPNNYSLLNQMRAMKSTETDPSNRGLKRFKGAESSVASQMRQSSEQRVMGGDPQIRNISGSASPIDNTNSSSVLAIVPQEVRAPSRTDSSKYPCSTSTTSTRVEYSQISPQMAPSWFEQYGTFKNGQMFSVSDAHKHSTLKAVEQQLPLENSSDTLCPNNIMEQENFATDSFHAGYIWHKSIPTPATAENSPSAQLMAHDFIDKSLAVAKPKKPKSAIPLPSWHEVVTQGSQCHLTTSMAEVEWAKAANRLVDKVKDKDEAFEDGPPCLRSKRRLTSTTQLMQQLFLPPESGILSSDASSTSEAVACICARLALADACSLMLCSKRDFSQTLDSINSLIDKHKIIGSNRISHHHRSEVTEHSIARAKKLESEFVRLDKKASVVDLRLECQELDKVSVINRFARFHGRGQADLAPPGPHRYVTPLHMPSVLPERLQCLSL